MFYLTALCDNEYNVTKTAEEINVTQPAISLAIKSLEQELGVDIFQRKARRLHLTKEGEVLLSHSRHILAQTEELTQNMQRFRANRVALRLGLNSFQAAYFMANLFPRCQKAFPRLQINVRERMAAQLLNEICSGELDLALVPEHTLETYDCKHLVNFHRLQWKEQIVLHTWPSHPLAVKNMVSWEDVAEIPLVQAWSVRAKEESGLTSFWQIRRRPNVILRTEQLYTIRSFILRHQASSLLPRTVWKPDSRIVCVPIEGREERPLGLATSNTMSLRSEVLQLIDFLCRLYVAV